MNKPFIDPYFVSHKERITSGPNQTTIVANAFIPISVYNRIFTSIRVGHGRRTGTTQTTLHLLISKLDQALTKYGITDYRHAELFEQLLANGEFVLPGIPGSSTTGIVQTTAERTDRGGTSGMGGETTTTEVQRTEFPSGSHVKGKGGKGRTKRKDLV